MKMVNARAALACAFALLAADAFATTIHVDMDAPAHGAQCALGDGGRLSVVQYDRDRDFYMVGWESADKQRADVASIFVARGRRMAIPNDNAELSGAMLLQVLDALLAQGMEPIPRGGHAAFSARAHLPHCAWPSLRAIDAREIIPADPAPLRIGGTARGGQCVFSGGGRALVLREEDQSTSPLGERFKLLVVDVARGNTLASLSISPTGYREWDANGGVATLAALDRLFDRIRARGLDPVRSGGVGAFLQAPAPACPWPSFDAILREVDEEMSRRAH